ncbi:hypothetical protein KAJ27_01680, partial [bacterium]|nr:hypothetical protein [bacterium]
MNYSRLVAGKIPLDRSSQTKILWEMRWAFLEFRHKDYQNLLRACSMGEEEIASRSEFYTELSRMLFNYLILVP